MTKGLWYQRVLRRVAVGLATGGMMFQVAESCDPQVRSTMLSGFQNLATTFVNAFFLLLANGNNGSSTTDTTTQT